uniref:Uncharacterized protein n=1 Tax=Aegilops tauschii subsp. strangulata TaxID=200361 RepID=A0A453AZQ4_AEGTS
FQLFPSGSASAPPLRSHLSRQTGGATTRRSGAFGSVPATVLLPSSCSERDFTSPAEVTPASGRRQTRRWCAAAGSDLAREGIPRYKVRSLVEVRRVAVAVSASSRVAEGVRGADRR